MPFSHIQHHARSGSTTHSLSAWISAEDTTILVGRCLGGGCAGVHRDFYRYYTCFLWPLQVFHELSFTDQNSNLSATDKYDLVLITGWINACMFTSVVWCVLRFIFAQIQSLTCMIRSVRMSLVCSIIRVTTSLLMRRLLFVVATFLTLFCAATFALESWWCGDNQATTSERTRSDCMLPGFIVIFEVASKYPNTMVIQIAES